MLWVVPDLNCMRLLIVVYYSKHSFLLINDNVNNQANQILGVLVFANLGIKEVIPIIHFIFDRLNYGGWI